MYSTYVTEDKMKRITVFLFCLIICFPLFGQELTLDQAINESTLYFNSRLPKQAKVAVINFDARSYTSRSAIISEYIIDELEKNLVNNGNFSMVDRQNIDKARNELSFNMSGEVSDESAQSIGRFLGAQVVIFGSIEPLGNIIRFRVRAIRVESGEILGVDTRNVQQSDVKRIFGKTPKPSVFENYSPFSDLIIVGYTYSPDKPIGFSLGIFGVYTTFGFAPYPDWAGYEKAKSGHLSANENAVKIYNSEPYNDQRFEIIDWVLGYNVAIIPNTLFLSLGVGLEAVNEWRLIYYSNYGYPGSYNEWFEAEKWKTSFLFETGLLVRFKVIGSFGPYLFGAYRNIGTDKHSFSVGGGISFNGWL